MKTLPLDMYQSGALATVVFLLGTFLVKKFPVFNKYCIPAPVVGGIVFALAHLALRVSGVMTFTFDTTIQSICMTLFFTSVGYTACFGLLKKGGVQVILYLVLAVVMCILQDALGCGLASVFNLDPRLGLCVGSIPMVGGHGTSGSFGPVLEKAGVVGATSVAIAAATYGLVAGSMLGGPIVTRKIKKFNLKSLESSFAEAAVTKDEAVHKLDAGKLTSASVYLLIAIGIGTIVAKLLSKTGLTFPSYIGAMLTAAIIRNIMDASKKKMPEREVDTIGSVGLTIFLSMALMNLKLWELAELALPMAVILIAQTILMAIFAGFVVFKVMGSDYESACMTTAFCGFGMGATPNAMANMQAVAKEYGPAPRAFFVVPLVGSLFVDFFNSIVITTFMNFWH